jgi:cytochrome d ubiquinol oxidase subunit I
MTDLFSARMQMAVSLGFHIIFSCIGMVMPFIMVASHRMWLKTKQPVYYDLTKAWSKGVAILFATGAVSGTVLSFELGLLWPTFMKHAGPIFGMPFSLEGTAFFIEAIAIGFYLYGWNKVDPYIHYLSGWVVGIFGVMSGIFVVAANGWMNAPSGFDWVDGRAINIDPVKAFFNAAWPSQALHMTIAAFEAVGFAVAGIHAYFLLKNPQSLLHQKAIRIAIWFAVIAALLQPISGDISAKDIAHRQPIKLAAAEAHFETQKYAPLRIGGIPDVETQTVKYDLKIPGALSFLSFGKFDAEVKGLKDFPRDEWPPVPVVHYSFQLMVACGVIMAGAALLYLIGFFRKKDYLTKPWFLKLLVFCTPLGFIAVEAGWTVTEVGRQPWIIYGIMKTKDALTPMPGLIVPFMAITSLYLFLAFLVSWLMVRQFKAITKNPYDSTGKGE